MFIVKNPRYRDRVQQVIDRAAFVKDLGLELIDLGPGWCACGLVVEPRHLLQQTHVVHAGVLATLADHTAGAAGSTLLAADEYVLTAEFKINLLRAARGERLVCRAQVLKPGRILSVVESEVFSVTDEAPTLVAKASVTLAVLKTSGAKATPEK